MSVTLVLGASGGAGATATTVGLANAWAISGSAAVAVDATVGGGDLVDRAADYRVTSSTIESGFPDGDLSVSSSGLRVVGRAWLEATEPDLQRIDWYLRHNSDASLYDLGHRAFGRDSARPLRTDPSAAIVLAVSARPDALSRVRTALQTISLTIGERAVHRTSVVLTHQVPGAPVVDVAELRKCLARRAVSVHEIPYDPHLGAGLTITAAELAPGTAAAYEQLREHTVDGECGTMSA